MADSGVATRAKAWFGAVLASVCVAAAGCRGSVERTQPATPDVPRVWVLGVAQDAGVPQPGCFEAPCRGAAHDPATAPMVASLALEDASGDVYLFDATPDLPRQLALLVELGVLEAPASGDRTRRPVDGVFLTHAHMGHYLGLAHFGFESTHADDVAVWGSKRMAEFLSTNAPWEQLVRLEEIELRPLESGRSVQLDGVRVEAVEVPHRGEYTDTFAYRIHGPQRTLLYVPDIDPWSRQADPVALFEGVDVALIDGTFYSSNELPGRDLASIGHPLIVDSLGQWGGREGLELRFIHLNHTNPALDPASDARRAIEAAGARVARRGEALGL